VWVIAQFQSQLLVKAGYSTLYNVTGCIVLLIAAGLPIEPVKKD
jgi:rhodanese-related sulfurtransferase